VYGQTKLDGERAVSEVAGAAALIVRTSWLYGSGGGFVPRILRLAREGGPLRVVDDQRGRPTWVENAAGLVLDLVERGARGIWHVADEGACTWLELAREALAMSGSDADVLAVSTKELAARAARPPYSVLDLTATENALGRKLMDWKEALGRFLHADPAN
jgi:dTDP-4-dehydrorhamnose reductase